MTCAARTTGQHVALHSVGWHGPCRQQSKRDDVHRPPSAEADGGDSEDDDDDDEAFAGASCRSQPVEDPR
jgi:hypothetical protein